MSELAPVSFAMSRWKLTRFIVLGCVIFMLGVWLVNHPNASRRYSPAFLVFDGYVLIVASMLGIGLFGRKLLQPKAELRLDDKGFRVDQGFSNGRFVPWTEVAGIAVVSIRGVKSIRVMLVDTDPDPLRAALPMRKRSFVNGWRRMGARKYLSIGTYFIDDTAGHIRQTMVDYWRSANSGGDNCP